MRIITILFILLLYPLRLAEASNLQKLETAPIAADSTELSPSITKTERAAPPKTGSASRVGWFSSVEFAMSSLVLIFGLIVFLIEMLVLTRVTFQADEATKLVAVTLIVISTLFIITAGFSSEQIAPAMGLFGTVAGYMLGKSRKGEE